MPPSQIAAYARFYQPGVTKVYAVATIANYASPTRIELDAGLDITRQLAAIDGFSVEANQIDTPDMASTFVSKVGGRTNAKDSSLTFYGAKSGVDVRATFTQGWTGFMVFLDGGDTTGYKMDVYPVQVISRPKQRGDGDAFQIMVQYSVTQTPAEDVAIP